MKLKPHEKAQLTSALADADQAIVRMFDYVESVNTSTKNQMLRVHGQIGHLAGIISAAEVLK